MKANWEELPKDNTPSWTAGIYVTMNPKGNIAMSRVTYEMLDEPAAFVIYFDKINNRIGLKPAALSTKNAYRACVYSGKGKVVFAHRLVRKYRIDLPQTVRFYDADIDEDGILVLDLRTAKVSPRALGYLARKRRVE
jgi:hypothetical protein